MNNSLREPANSGGLTQFLKTNALHPINLLYTILGFVGNILTLWAFIRKIYEVRHDQVNMGVYIECIILLIVFCVCFILATRMIDNKSKLYTLVISLYGITLSVFVSICFAIVSDTIITHGFDLFNKPGIARNILNEHSKYGISIMLFCSTLFGMIYFTKRAPTVISQISVAPIVLTLGYFAYDILSNEKLQKLFQTDFNNSDNVAYTTVSIMTLFLLTFSIREIMPNK